jgi:hypothetical protein
MKRGTTKGETVDEGNVIGRVLVLLILFHYFAFY